MGGGEGAQGGRWRGGGGSKERLHNKNALNYRMKLRSNCVIGLA